MAAAIRMLSVDPPRYSPCSLWLRGAQSVPLGVQGRMLPAIRAHVLPLNVGATSEARWLRGNSGLPACAD
jgi:hypothetical protein